MTDPTIRFQYETARFMLYLDKLNGLPISKLRKLFKLMLSEPWNNEEAITATELFLPDAVERSKEAWKQASLDYQHGWRLVEKPTRKQTKEEKQADAAIRANNAALVRAVKKTKATHERWVKINETYNQVKLSRKGD